MPNLQFGEEAKGAEVGSKENNAPDDEDSEIYLDESFFIDDSYVIQSFHYGSHTIDVYCLQSSSTDYDLTGQMIWPGADLMNSFILKNSHIFQGMSIIELGSGVGITGLLCAQFCQKVVMTDHNDTVLKVLKRNVELQKSSCSNYQNKNATCEKLEWGNKEQLAHILKEHPQGFDLILGADICYQQDSIHSLFKTVHCLLNHKQTSICKFILAYVSRAKSVDTVVLREAQKHDLKVSEIEGTRSKISGGVFEGLLYEVQSTQTPDFKNTSG